MNRIVSVIFATLLVITASLQANAFITEEQAIQAVKNFIGDQNAQVAMTTGETGIIQPDLEDSMYGFWIDNDPYYDMTCGSYQYFVDGNTGFITSVIVTSDLTIYPADALNMETIWSKYTILPRSQMQEQTTDSWVLRYSDGSWNTKVQLSFSRDSNGLIDQVVASYKPVPSSRPTITITAQQALAIAQTVAGSYSWQDDDLVTHAYPYYDLESSYGVYWHTNQQGLPEPVYTLTFLVSSDPAVDASWLDDSSDADLSTCASYVVYVNAATGSIIHSAGGNFQIAKKPKPAPVKKIQKHTIITKPASMVSLNTMKSLAKGHKLSAKAGEKAFTLDSKRVALPSKVVAKAGTLYLPWQALKSLPGVKCSYDAKLNKLDITTAKVTEKPAAKTTPKPVK